MNVVIDASAFVRATDGNAEAIDWIERIESGQVSARAPDLLYAEAANALLVKARTGRIETRSAQELIDLLSSLPVRVTPLRELAGPAFRVAEQRGLSAYDACYVVLAEQARATLVTADEAAAEAAAESILLS